MLLGFKLAPNPILRDGKAPKQKHSTCGLLHGYRLQQEGTKWHWNISKTLRRMCFKLTNSDPDIRIRDCDIQSTYFCVNVDDAIFIGSNPRIYLDIRKHQYNLESLSTILVAIWRLESIERLLGLPRTISRRYLEGLERYQKTKLKSWGSPVAEVLLCRI